MSIQLYPDHAGQKLGFETLRNLLREYCLSELGEQKLASLDYATDPAVIEQRLRQTTEFKTILDSEGNFPTEHYHSLDEALHFLHIPNSVLDRDSFHKILQVVVTIRDILNFFKKGVANYPELEALIQNIPYEKSILESIDAVLDAEGAVKSNVSSHLKDLRKQIQGKRGELDQQFRAEYQRAQEKGKLSEEGESIRNGKRVLAIDATHKNVVKGIIHDESSTGKTVFIEPRSTFEISNAIFELQQEEKREIYRILKNLTEEIRPYKDILYQYQDLLGLMDFLRAKARLAQSLKAEKPHITDSSEIHLEKAVHPLLYLNHQENNLDTIPMDLTLTSDKGILVISGPNAGGKSVAMKTAGILQLMTQAGLLIPAASSSTLGPFNQLLVDIGDDQSIENDLSTYSSHLKNMKYFCEHANSSTLFLIDELGTGTDPELGGPIAEAILEWLNEREATGVITTHYTNLKLFATETPRMENASMTFDKETLKPTYQLSIGRPGSSYAFEVARNIGFREEILEKAQSKVKKEYQNLDELLGELEQVKQTTEAKDRKLENKQKQLDQLLKKQKQLSAELEKNKKQHLLESKQNALNHLNQLNRQFEKLVKDWKESEKEAKEERRKDIGKELKRQRRNLEKDVEQLQQQVSGNKETQETPIKEGSRVKLNGGNQVGEVEAIKGNKVTVIFGNLKTETNLKELEPVDQRPAARPERKKSQRNFEWQEKAGQFKPQIDVRGKSKDEALQAIENWLDKAVLLNQTQLKVLHGKGSGVLKDAIRKKLKEYDFVKDTYSEHVEYGGDGVTIVELE